MVDISEGVKLSSIAPSLIRWTNMQGYYNKTGLPFSPKIKFGENDKNYNWKGDNCKYGSLHSWIFRKLGKAKKCGDCGKIGLGKHQMHWANIDHEYRKDVKDYIELCPRCHYRYDKVNGLRSNNN